MAMNDLISNYLTRVRNAIVAGYDNVSGVPSSNIIVAISEVLKSEGYIKGFEVTQIGVKRTISVDLKSYRGKNVITEIKRVSKPGRRVYAKADEIPYIKEGLGIAVLSTTKGVVSDSKARELGLGGEVLCKVS